MTAFDTVTARIEALTGHAGRNGSYLCPAHDDSTPSLSVRNGDGKVILHCHAGCTVNDICAALDLTINDLFDHEPSANGKSPELVATYDYVDETGALLFQVCRYRPKTFRQRRPDGHGGWIWDTQETRRVLYRLPAVVAAVAAGRTVYIAEGEKDVHALEAAGYVATCNPAGAGKWRPEYSDTLAGANQVVIVADTDDTGRRHALEVRDSVTKYAAHIRILEPTHGKDVADHLGAGLAVDDLICTFDSDIPNTGTGPGLADWLQPIDWEAFWATEPPEADWLIEPIVPAGRQVAMYSPAKGGKSLLALDAAAAVATGRPVLGQPAKDPVDVIYIDQEMTDADLRERLEDLGYGPDDDLSHLHYYQLTVLPPLDTEQGGQVLEAIVARYNARLVVLDTMARVVAGDENQADTYRNFYRCTGLRLKAMRVALWRLDHGGKDPERGQRGSSEKAGDVDVVFRLTAIDNAVILKCTHTRVPWVPNEITVYRQETPCLAHLVGSGIVPAVVVDIIADLERLGVPVDATGNTAFKMLRSSGTGRRRAEVLAAVKIRGARQ